MLIPIATLWLDTEELTPCQKLDINEADRVFFTPGSTKPAKAICETCHVKNECLTIALNAEQGLPVRMRFGVFGGLDPRDRARLDFDGKLAKQRHMRRSNERLGMRVS